MGKTEVAKWALLKTGKKDINTLVEINSPERQKKLKLSKKEHENAFFTRILKKDSMFDKSLEKSLESFEETSKSPT